MKNRATCLTCSHNGLAIFAQLLTLLSQLIMFGLLYAMSEATRPNEAMQQITTYLFVVFALLLFYLFSFPVMAEILLFHLPEILSGLPCCDEFIKEISRLSLQDVPNQVIFSEEEEEGEAPTPLPVNKKRHRRYLKKPKPAEHPLPMIEEEAAEHE